MAEPTTLEEWLLTRPPCVQELAKEFPVGTVVDGGPAGRLYLMGWTEDDMLILSPIDPHERYDEAYAARVHLCAAHLRSK